jgi:hypothetical protein
MIDEGVELVNSEVQMEHLPFVLIGDPSYANVWYYWYRMKCIFYGDFDPSKVLGIQRILNVLLKQ